MKKKLLAFSFCVAAVLLSFAVFNVISAISLANGEDFEFKWIIPPVNHRGNPFTSDRTWVQKEEGGTWTLYDINGNIIKDGFEAMRVFSYKNGLALFKDEKTQKSGFVNISGDIVIPPIISISYTSVSEGLIVDRDENNLHLYGFVDMRGEWVIPPKYAEARNFSEGLSAVRIERNGKWGYIDKNGTLVIDCLFEDADEFKGGSAIIRQNSKFGVIDQNGHFLVEPIYDEAFFSSQRTGHELIGVAKDGKVGFINASGDIMIDFKFKFIDEGAYKYYNVFNDDGLAIVVMNEPGLKLAVIDKAGDIVFKIKEDITLMPLTFFDNYFIGATKNRIMVVFDKNGNMYDLSSYIDYNSFLLSSFSKMTIQLTHKPYNKP